MKGFHLVRILCCSQSGNHPENNLAKFGYILDMKVGKQKRKKTDSICTLGYLLELIIKIWQSENNNIIIIILNLTNLLKFFHEKSFV
jgi:hypothetical protein